MQTPPGLLGAMSEPGGAMCIVSGAAGSGKTSWASHAARSSSGASLRIDVARAARADGNVSLELRELLEDSTLVNAAIVLDNVGETLCAGSHLAALLEEVVAYAPLQLFVVVDDIASVNPRLATRALTHVRIEPPPPAVRREMWSCARSGSPIPSTLADDLVLTPRQIRNAVSLVEAGVDPVAAALEQVSGNGLTMPDRTSSKLDALVLPSDVRAEIVELIGAIRARAEVSQDVSSGRGRAVTAMFNGESGTGKTFACEVIAAEVGLPLMRVNVASLVDKYIGETEKNLVRVFAQAQGQGGILFFDEADAMFGTRTDVSRAQDRYANLETNLLLQLMEQFTGIVLLTTNLKQNIDPAFMRRIMFKVYFEAPEPVERVKLWRSVLPSDRYEPGIDFGRLARTFELSGGSIRAAALRAAYRATAAKRSVSMADLAECAQLETHGMGRVATW
ncbi:MAG: ATP-binding protein [Kofleriaceae bacterium]